MSTVLGAISLISLICVVIFSSKSGGEAPVGYGLTGVFAVVFSVVGLCLGVVTVRNREYYRLFPVVGIVLNLMSLTFLGLILYIGIRI